MYAHKVLDSYLAMLKKTGYPFEASISHPIYRIKDSVKYHFDDIESIRDMTAKQRVCCVVFQMIDRNKDCS